MTSKIFRSTVLVAVVVLLCTLGVIMGVLYTHFSQTQVEQLKDELSLAATGTEHYGRAFLENVKSDRFRITWIGTDGTVLFDTRVDQTNMENHSQRKEFQDALQTGTGSDVRTSSTLTEQTFYEARRLADGTVLRISTNQDSALYLMLALLWRISGIAALAIALSAILARRMAKKIVQPLNTLDLEQPLKSDVYEEISPLLHRIHLQHNQIRAQMEQLRQKADEFTQIVGNLQEGLILLNSEGTILSINPAAKKLFEVDDGCIGKSFLTIDRSETMRTALNDALDRGRGSARKENGDRIHQLDLSRIISDGNVMGVAVLAFDITERAGAERLRREFSANVSHELKTPLQSILGSAELLESGMAKPEDTPRFIRQIRSEASRLVTLIGDIIRLSQLDEGISMTPESVELLSLARETAASLQPNAQQKNVRVTVSGTPFTVEGVRRMLHEIVYNLCDNAIKYNLPGGSVHIHVQSGSVTVSDTGIGIPLQYHDRVFERFFRVDKSHSRASGGTGLGLSIVKHAAGYHNATISLVSTPGKGTSICVRF